MPRPPFQMRIISIGSPSGPKNRSGVVMMWYRRAPTMPASTETMAMSRTWSKSPPTRFQRTVVMATAAMMPARMHNA